MQTKMQRTKLLKNDSLQYVLDARSGVSAFEFHKGFSCSKLVPNPQLMCSLNWLRGDMFTVLTEHRLVTERRIDGQKPGHIIHRAMRVRRAVITAFQF